MSIKSSKI